MKLAGIFSDNMVLQRDKKVCIFGTGEESENIQIEIDGIKADAIVEQGKWRVSLPAHGAGGPYKMKITCGEQISELGNIMYGEVWFAGGQSNMELEVQNADFGEQELKEADYENIRYYNVIKTPYIDNEVLKREAAHSWHICREGDFCDMSAVAYFFAKKIYGQLNVPIGIVDCYQGGTSVSCWLSEENLMAVPEGIPYMEEYKNVVNNQTEEEYDQMLEAYNQSLSEYNARVEVLKKQKPDIKMEELNEKAGLYPWPPPMGTKSLYRPCGLYSAMICRIVPYTVRGILYYQGEEDASKTDGYDKLLVQLISQFRRDFEDAALPFVIVQLPMFMAKNEPEDYTWAKLRLAQEHVYRLIPYTGFTVLLDLGEYDNIHPTDKKTPGTRLALQVLERVYKEPVKGSAMFFSFAKREGSSICLSFTNTYGEIQVKDNALLDIRNEEGLEGNPVGFELSENGRDWYPACASVNRLHIYVWSDRLRRPAYVRYGYFNYGKVNVYNAAGLPLAPFYEEI